MLAPSCTSQRDGRNLRRVTRLQDRYGLDKIHAHNQPRAGSHATRSHALKTTKCHRPRLHQPQHTRKRQQALKLQCHTVKHRSTNSVNKHSTKKHTHTHSTFDKNNFQAGTDTLLHKNASSNRWAAWACLCDLLNR